MNDTVAVWHRQPPGALAPFFRRQTNEFKVHPRQYLVLGDNTVNSHDGRKWGDFPQEKVIGRFLAVYWPWSRRFDWAPE
jgi:type IV secretory pathway protease TraF